MIVQYVFEIVYLTFIGIIIVFMGIFYALTRKPPGGKSKQEQNQVNAEQPKMEKSWLYFLLAVVLIGNLVTLSPLIPSASFGLWTQAPTETITIQVENYHFIMPQQPIILPVGKAIQLLYLLM